MPNVLDKNIALAVAAATKKPSVWTAVGIFGARYLIFVLAAIAVGWIWTHVPAHARLAHIAEVGMTTLLSWIVTFALEYVINRARPYDTLRTTPLARPGIETPSFPSAHATIAFAIAGWVMFVSAPIGILLLAIAAMVSVSRVIIGVHYLTDILAGAFVGVAISFAVHFFTL